MQRRRPLVSIDRSGSTQCPSAHGTIALRLLLGEAIPHKFRFDGHELECVDSLLLTVARAVQEAGPIDQTCDCTAKELGKEIRPLVGVASFAVWKSLRPAAADDGRTEGACWVKPSASIWADACGANGTSAVRSCQVMDNTTLTICGSKEREANGNRSVVSSTALRIHGGSKNGEHKHERSNKL